jgi:hypothetical protein
MAAPYRAVRSSCSGDVECEYGSDPDVACDAVATCMSGAWSVKPAPSPACSTTSTPGCPSTYAALSQETTCSSVGASCFYPEARCGCSTHCEMFGRDMPFWCCPDAPPGAGCPSPRPRLGSPCALMDGGVCDYGGCSGNVMLICTGGVWQEDTMFGCPG